MPRRLSAFGRQHNLAVAALVGADVVTGMNYSELPDRLSFGQWLLAISALAAGITTLLHLYGITGPPS